MHILADAFWLPKLGNDDSEYEDAYWPNSVVDESGSSFHFAIADGATESSYSRQWANLLVQAFGRGEMMRSTRATCLRNLRNQWASFVNSRPLPWYAEENVRDGAYSTIVGVGFYDKGIEKSNRRWEVMAIGDSCLVQIRGDHVVESFPITDSSSFNNRPRLLSSKAGRRSDVRWAQKKGTWEPGDSFYLMTDALACWFLGEIERGEMPWRGLRDLKAQGSDFVEFIDELRTAHAIRNDDVTLLRVAPN